MEKYAEIRGSQSHAIPRIYIIQNKPLYFMATKNNSTALVISINDIYLHWGCL